MIDADRPHYYSFLKVHPPWAITEAKCNKYLNFIMVESIMCNTAIQCLHCDTLALST